MLQPSLEPMISQAAAEGQQRVDEGILNAALAWSLRECVLLAMSGLVTVVVVPRRL